MKANKKTRQGLRATSLQKALIASNVIIFIISWVGFYLVQDWIRKTVTESSQRIQQEKRFDANQISSELTANKTNVEKAASLMASPNTYQTEVSSSLYSYAQKSGITINQISPTAAPEALNPIISTTTMSPRYILLTIRNPVRCEDLVKFIKYTETSTPKMQVTNVNIESQGEAGNVVNVSQLIIEVYVR